MAKNLVFGGRCTELLGLYDQELLSWRTLQISFEWAEQQSLQALPKSGMTASGQLYVVEQTSELPTCDADGFVLPTPLASDAGPAAILNENTNIVFTSNGTPRKVSNNGVNGSLGLARTVMLLPTPTASDPLKHSTGGLHRHLVRGQKYSAGDHRATNQTKPIGNKRRHLNPQFVVWMMGYPLDWLD